MKIRIIKYFSWPNENRLSNTMTICKFIKDKRFWGFPGGSDDKESPCSVGDLGLIPVSGRSPEEGNGNPLQYSCLENPIDRGAWRASTWYILALIYSFPFFWTVKIKTYVCLKDFRLVGLVAKLCPTLVTPWTGACLALLFMGFSRQEYWVGCLLQGIFLTQVLNPRLLHCRQIFCQLSYKGSKRL